MEIHPIAYYHSIFTSNFGIPRQSGIIPDLKGQIVFEPEYRNDNYIRGLEEYDYLWLIWEFSANKHKAVGATVRPPRLGGNKRMGVFATRSPYRPNPLGLSSVKIHSFEHSASYGTVIHVLGGDLKANTPIYDIKPYIEFTDSHINVNNGFIDTNQWQTLSVRFTDEALSKYSADLQHIINEVLRNNPRPQYQDDKDKIYTITLGDENIHFKIVENDCYVL